MKFGINAHYKMCDDRQVSFWCSISTTKVPSRYFAWIDDTETEEQLEGHRRQVGTDALVV